MGLIPTCGSIGKYRFQGGIFRYMYIDIALQRFCEYSKFIRGYSDETIRRYKQAISLFQKMEAIASVEEIDDKKTRDFFLRGRTERNWEPNSFITFHKSIVVFFRWCVEQGYLEKNYADDIEMPKVHKKLPPKLTKQQALRILEVVYNYPYDYTYLRYRNHAIFSMFIFVGLRKRELLNLKLADVDLQNMSVFIREGKGGKDRIVPISSTLAESLARYLTERGRLKKTCPEFFTSLNRNSGFTETGMKRLAVKMAAASGVAFTIHKLRHTFATLMLEGGCDIYSLSRMMGHSDIKTTTIYLAATAEHLRSQMVKHPLNDVPSVIPWERIQKRNNA